MLCRQRTFFLANNQYEPVMLELVRVQNGSVYYTFRKSENVDGYAIYHRISLDSAQTWEAWQRTERQLTGDPAEFGLSIGQGYMCETYIVAIGDGTKQPSEPSNIITTIVPKEPALSPPIIEAYPFYFEGRPYPAIYHSYVPTGVTKWVLWMREMGDADWVQQGVISDSGWSIINKQAIETGVTYQFITAWVSNDGAYLLSDISNIATITLPDASITTLLPPIRFEAIFTTYQGYYMNRLTYGRGDMRSTGYITEYRRSTEGVWKTVRTEEGDGKISYTAEEASQIALFSWWAYNSEEPIPGEVWQYRLKNFADGFGTSEYSEIFEITVPSLLPRLDTPTMHLNKSGSAIVVSWEAVSNATGYKVERRLTSETEFLLLSDTIPSTMTSFNDSNNLVLDSTYVYHVTALGNGTNFQDSLPAEDSITYQEDYHLQPPVISNLAESGFDITMDISNLDGANSRTVYVEMSENGGAWTRVAAGNVASVAVTSISVTVESWKINGGALRFRAYQYGGGTIEDSDYSDIASITIDEREWLLRWTGSAWDYCTDVTGGWSSPTIRYSDGDVAGNVRAVDLGGGTLRLQGTGYYMTGAMSSGQAGLNTTYSKICMIGDLIKQVDGTDNHAWFGNGHTYSFSGGQSLQLGNYTFAGSESGRAAAGTKTDPSVNAVGRGTYSTSTGAHVYFRFYNGYADVKGIFAIKR